MIQYVLMSDSKEKQDSSPKKSRWLSKDTFHRLVLNIGIISPRIVPFALGVALGIWCAYVGSGLIVSLVAIVCLALFACWVYKKGYDAGRK